MEIALIPSCWLEGASWDEVAAPLRGAGHTVHTLTLPGLESCDVDRSGAGLRDLDAVVAVVDSVPDPVVRVAGGAGARRSSGAQ